MISKPAFNRAQRLQEDDVRRRSQRCFDAIIEQLGEAEALGEPMRIGDQVVIPIVPVDVDGQTVPATRLHERRQPGSTESLAVSLGEEDKLTALERLGR